MSARRLRISDLYPDLEAAVNKVGTASGEIVEIVQLIGNIAEETNSCP